MAVVAGHVHLHLGPDLLLVEEDTLVLESHRSSEGDLGLVGIVVPNVSVEQLDVLGPVPLGGVDVAAERSKSTHYCVDGVTFRTSTGKRDHLNWTAKLW